MMIPIDAFMWVNVSSVPQVEQGAHYIRKFLIYSKRKAFLVKAVVELVYKFDEKSYRECLKRQVVSEVRFKIIFFDH